MKGVAGILTVSSVGGFLFTLTGVLHRSTTKSITTIQIISDNNLAERQQAVTEQSSLKFKS